MGIDRTLRCIAAVVVLIWVVAPPLIHSWPGWDRPGGRLRPAAVGRGGLPRLEILTHLGALAVVLVAAAGAGGPARPPINGGYLV